MSPPAPSKILKCLIVVRLPSQEYAGLKTDTGVLSFEIPFVRSCDKKPTFFAALGLQPVPRRAGISSHLSEHQLKREQGGCSVTKSAPEQNPPHREEQSYDDCI